MEKRISNRIAYWDNLKAILIFLVVLGHFLLPVHSQRGRSVEAIYTWIYMFHMPAFVFVSGYFAKRYVQKGGSDVRKLIGFLILYVIFSVAVWGIKVVFTRDISMLYIFTTSGAPWYLMCMFLWYLIVPHCAKIQPSVMIPFAVIAALLVGLDYGAGDFLALSRCFVFFPFFLVGYHFDGALIHRIKPWMKAISTALLLSTLIATFLFPEFFNLHSAVLYGKSAYPSPFPGITERFIWFIASGILVAALLCIIPQKELFFTYIGQRTLAIYIIHRLIREVCQQIGVYDILLSEVQVQVFCIASSAAITFVFSEKHLSALFSKAFTAKYKSLFTAPAPSPWK